METINHIRRSPKIQKIMKSILQIIALFCIYQITVFNTWNDQKMRLSDFVTFSGCYIETLGQHYVRFLETEGTR